MLKEYTFMYQDTDNKKPSMYTAYSECVEYAMVQFHMEHPNAQIVHIKIVHIIDCAPIDE